MYKIYKRKVPQHHKCYWVVEDTIKAEKLFVFDLADRFVWKPTRNCSYSPELYELYTEVEKEEELLPAMRMIAMMEGKVGKYK